MRVYGEGSEHAPNKNIETLAEERPRKLMLPLLVWLVSGLFCVVVAYVLGQKFPYVADQELALSTWQKFLGSWHPLLIHLPIGLLVILPFMEFGNLLKGRRQVHGKLLFFVFLIASWAAFCGYFLGSESTHKLELLSRHLRLSLGLLIVLWLTLGALLWHRRHRNFFSQLLYFLLLCMASIFCLFSGHLGGSLTHGERHLTRYMPEVVLEKWEKTLNGVDRGLVNFGLPALMTGEKEPAQ